MTFGRRGNEPDERLTSPDFRGMRQNTSEASGTGAISEVGRSAGFKAAVFPTETAYERELRKMPPHTRMIQRGEKGASELNRAGEKRTDRM